MVRQGPSNVSLIFESVFQNKMLKIKSRERHPVKLKGSSISDMVVLFYIHWSDSQCH